MAGGYYTALSGMRTRMDALDRLAADIANASTAGYKTERAGTPAGRSPVVRRDAAVGSRRGQRRGADSICVPARWRRPGERWTLRFRVQVFSWCRRRKASATRETAICVRGIDGTLSTDEGNAVLGTDGPIKIGTGTVEVGRRRHGSQCRRASPAS